MKIDIQCHFSAFTMSTKDADTSFVQICLVCNKPISTPEFFSVHDNLPQVQPETKLGDALKMISNSEDMFLSTEKEFTCSTCYLNTDAALRFLLLCNKAVENINEQQNEESQGSVDESCITCNRKLNDNQKVSIHKYLPNVKPRMTQWDALKILSNFDQWDEMNGPAQTCYICFCNTASSVRFLSLYNRSMKAPLSNDIEHESEGLDDLYKDNQCRFCDETFASRLFLKRHLVKLHFKDAKEMDPNINKSKCKFCGKYYQKEYMLLHTRTHTGVTPYECNICGRKFTGVGCYKKHLSVHFDERPHLCSICGASFKGKQTYNKHMAKHAGTSSCSCEVCGKVLIDRESLRRHYLTHSDERKFLCEHCSKGFKSKKYLKQHLVTHADIRPIECTFCGKRFTQKHCLRSHLAKSCMNGTA